MKKIEYLLEKMDYFWHSYGEDKTKKDDETGLNVFDFDAKKDPKALCELGEIFIIMEEVLFEDNIRDLKNLDFLRWEGGYQVRLFYYADFDIDVPCLRGCVEVMLGKDNKWIKNVVGISHI